MENTFKLGIDPNKLLPVGQPVQWVGFGVAVGIVKEHLGDGYYALEHVYLCMDGLRVPEQMKLYDGRISKPYGMCHRKYLREVDMDFYLDHIKVQE